MIISKLKGIAATEASYAFFAYCGDYVIIDSKLHFLTSSFYYGLTAAFIIAHLKSSGWRFSCYPICDFNSEIPVTSSIKALIDGAVFLQVVT